MNLRRAWTPATTRLLQLGLAMLVVQYVLLIGGVFGAALVFPAQRLNLLGSAVLGLAWLGVRLVQRRPLQWTGLEWPLLAFAASQWLTLLTSAQPRLGLDWAASVTTWIVAFFILADLLVNGWPRAHWTNALIVAATLLAAHGVWSAVQWFAGWAAIGTLPPVTFRYVGLLGHANLTACVINLLWPIVIAKMIRAERLVSRLALGALATGLGLTSFFTSSRAGWLAAGAATVVLIVMVARSHSAQSLRQAWRSAWQRLNGPTRPLALGGIVLAGGAGVWLLLRQAQHITHGSLFDSRREFWSAAWDLFKSRPLTGVGPDLYAWYYSRYASIPPEFFAPHAHSLIMQTLSGSGVVGLGALLFLGAAVAFRLWQHWEATGRQLELTCQIAALAGFAVHHLFDFLLTPFTLLLVVILLALALTPPLGAATSRRIRPILIAPLVLLPMGVFAFLLIGSSRNDAALKLAADGQWPLAARAFEQTAQADPQLTLYWEEAAYAYTRAGEVQNALPLWERAARDDPYWAVLPATIGALKHDLAPAQAARTLAPGSYLFALNAGLIAEDQGDTSAAQEAYRSALALKPASADALFWQQSPLRQGLLQSWRATRPVDSSALARGWSALTSQAPAQAVGWFRQAAAEDPNSLAPYEGLGQAYLQLRDLGAAQNALQAGLAVPVTSPEPTIPLHLLAGDLHAARGDRSGAMAEYNAVFFSLNDYDLDGPGTYGQTLRSWLVFHRETLPGELVPQLPRADITAQMDQRFAELAQWYGHGGQTSLACYILGRVHQEAPVSVSGSLYQQQCPAVSH